VLSSRVEVAWVLERITTESVMGMPPYLYHVETLRLIRIFGVNKDLSAVSQRTRQQHHA
jgi:hypothetical protein